MYTKPFPPFWTWMFPSPQDIAQTSPHLGNLPWILRLCLLSTIEEPLKSSGWREHSGTWGEGRWKDMYAWSDLQSHLLPLLWLEWPWESGKSAFGEALNGVSFNFRPPFIITPWKWNLQPEICSQLNACLWNAFILVGCFLLPTSQLHFKS